MSQIIRCAGLTSLLSFPCKRALSRINFGEIGGTLFYEQNLGWINCVLNIDSIKQSLAFPAGYCCSYTTSTKLCLLVSLPDCPHACQSAHSIPNLGFHLPFFKTMLFRFKSKSPRDRIRWL